jgi:hypothetical protein
MTLYALGLARVLAANTHLIAAHEHAGDCYREIKQLCDDIEHRINRPIPPRFCGVCDGEIGYGYNNEHSRPCGTRLYAPRADSLVTCPACGKTHTIKTLFNDTMEDSGEVLLTQPEILYIMAEYGQPITERTLQRWRKSHLLEPRGTIEGKAAFYLADVRYLRDAQQATRLANLSRKPH